MYFCYIAVNAPGTVIKMNRYAPKRNMPPTPSWQPVLGPRPSAAYTARQSPPFLGLQFNLQLMAGKSSTQDTMVLDSKGKTYDTFQKHEPTSV